MSSKIKTYAELQKMIRKALREQHPEWIDAHGECTLCNVYEARFAKLLAVFAPVLLALNHELSMCSRLSWLLSPRSQATHDLLVPFSSTARSDGSLSAFWRSRLMTLLRFTLSLWAEQVRPPSATKRKRNL